MSGASDQVVVGEARGLHEGVDDRRPDAPEPPLHHVLADGLRLRGLYGDLLASLVLCHDRLLVHKPPQVLRERPDFLRHLLRTYH